MDKEIEEYIEKLGKVGLCVRIQNGVVLLKYEHLVVYLPKISKTAFLSLLIMFHVMLERRSN